MECLARKDASSGVAIQDLVIAAAVFDRATALGLATWVDFQS